MEELWYWIIEYAKVFGGYGFLLFVWPLTVFRKYLKEKSITFRFAFCVTAQIMLINTIVLGLGLLHILNAWTIRILFWGIFLFSLRDKFRITKDGRKKFKSFVTGTYGVKQWLLVTRTNIGRFFKGVWLRFWQFYKQHWLEYTLLFAVLVYGMIYFSYGAFCDHSYGFGDMYVHHYWTYALTQGDIFAAGVYPEAMHCVLYALHTIFGIEIYNCLLFLAGIHVAIILLSAYCLMRELFAWRYSGIFVLILFLTVDLMCVDEVFSMSRLQWTLPQEYGFHAMYLCALFLLRYLRSTKKGTFRKKETKGYWNEDLFLFMMALAATVAIHFYATIMAFLLCLGCVLFFLHKVFRRKYFIPLVTAAISAVIIAFLPMAGALASGIPFQGSIGWAVNVMNGTNTEEGRTHAIQSQEEGETEGAADNQHEGVTASKNQAGAEQSVFDKGKLVVKQAYDVAVEKIKGVYHNGYVTLYKAERAQWILFFTGIAAALYLLWSFVRMIVAFIRRLRHKPKKPMQLFDGYLKIIMASIVFMVIYAGPYIGLPELIAGSRLCSTEQMLILMVIVIPLDMLLTLVHKIIPRFVPQFLSLAVSVGLVAMVWYCGYYHSYLYFELTRYNAAVEVTNRIKKELPQYSYTLVTTTDELYHVIQDGRHEELVTFLSYKGNKRYTLPTEYVFLYVEKKPIQYAQSHFFTGPKWLAQSKYHTYYSSYFSVCPEINASQISEKVLNDTLMISNSQKKIYSDLEKRTILESRLYHWCQTFDKTYPNELKTYYEDENFVCYYFRQNPQFLYDLEIE